MRVNTYRPITLRAVLDLLCALQIDFRGQPPELLARCPVAIPGVGYVGHEPLLRCGSFRPTAHLGAR